MARTEKKYRRANNQGWSSVPLDLAWYADRGLLDKEVQGRPPLPDAWTRPLAEYAWRGADRLNCGRRILRGQTMDEQEEIMAGGIFEYAQTKEDKS